MLHSTTTCRLIFQNGTLYGERSRSLSADAEERARRRRVPSGRIPRARNSASPWTARPSSRRRAGFLRNRSGLDRRPHCGTFTDRGRSSHDHSHHSHDDCANHCSHTDSASVDGTLPKCVTFSCSTSPPTPKLDLAATNSDVPNSSSRLATPTTFTIAVEAAVVRAPCAI